MPTKPWSLAVKAIVYDQAGRCLALRRDPEAGRYPGQWDLPGGKVDAGEDFAAALRREAAEETGLRVELVAVVGAWERELSAVRSVLLVMMARHRAGRVRLSAEHTEFRWVSPDQLARLEWSDEIRPVVAATLKQRKLRGREQRVLRRA